MDLPVALVFLGAALVRLPDGRSVLTGRSACDTCDKELGPAELIPILSWVMQGGKCRECGSAIDRWQLAAEAGGDAAGALAAGAPWLADRLHDPGLVTGLRLVALTLPAMPSSESNTDCVRWAIKSG